MSYSHIEEDVKEFLEFAEKSNLEEIDLKKLNETLEKFQNFLVLFTKHYNVLDKVVNAKSEVKPFGNEEHYKNRLLSYMNLCFNCYIQPLTYRINVLNNENIQSKFTGLFNEASSSTRLGKNSVKLGYGGIILGIIGALISIYSSFFNDKDISNQELKNDISKEIQSIKIEQSQLQKLTKENDSLKLLFQKKVP